MEYSLIDNEAHRCGAIQPDGQMDWWMMKAYAMRCEVVLFNSWWFVSGRHSIAFQSVVEESAPHSP